MLTAALTDKGQVALPKALRNAHQLKKDSKIRFVINGGGAILKIVSRSANDVGGLLRQPEPTTVSLDGMNVAIRKRAKRLKRFY